MNLFNVFDKVIEVITDVEKNSDSKVKGSYKKEIAVEAINTVIDIPMLPEFIEGKIFKEIIGLLVDFGVYIHNKFDLFNNLETVAEVTVKVANAADNISDTKVKKTAKKAGEIAEIVEKVSEAISEEVDEIVAE